MKPYLLTRRLLAAVYTAEAEDIRHPNDFIEVG